jgi:glycosyltransferase involved in cell wall biosynthesis
MKVSVVIPVYNVKPYLERCVNSVLRQTYKDLEIILVDDGSTDGSGELCDQIALTDKRISVIHQENQGLSGARNIGIRNATGEYIIFLDSDDEWVLDDGLEKLIQEGGDNDLLVFRCIDIWGDGRRIKRREYDVENINKLPDAQAVFAYLVQTQQLHVAAWTVMVRKIVLTDHEIYFPSRLISEDIFWSLHLWQFVQTVKVLNLYLLGYYHREGSITTSPSIRVYNSYDTIFTYWKEQISNNCTNATAVAAYLADMWINRGYHYYQLNEADKPVALNILKRHANLLNFAGTPKACHVKIMNHSIGVKNTILVLGLYWRIRMRIKKHVI